jgi:hypothetical protein
LRSLSTPEINLSSKALRDRYGRNDYSHFTHQVLSRLGAVKILCGDPGHNVFSGGHARKDAVLDRTLIPATEDNSKAPDGGELRWTIRIQKSNVIVVCVGGHTNHHVDPNLYTSSEVGVNQNTTYIKVTVKGVQKREPIYSR